MKYISNEWSEKHKELGKTIRNKYKFEQSMELLTNLHAQLHSSRVSNSNEINYINPLINDLNTNEYAIMPGSKDETIAWVLWHIARIEDLTINILIMNEQQVFNSEWQSKLNVGISDTANALTDDEIMELSKKICINELLNYRDAVGIRTQEVLKQLVHDEMKKKIQKERIERILSEGGVTEQDESIWLLDFWGKKDYAGILLMPPTRHVTLHLNDCYKWKEKIRTKKKFFRIK